MEGRKQPVCDSIVSKVISEEVSTICAETLHQMRQEARTEEQWLGVEQQITQQLKGKVRNIKLAR